MTVRFGSIRFRLIAWYAGLLVALSLLFGVYTYSWVRHYLEAATRQTLERRAQIIASTLVENIGATGEPYVARELEARYAPEANDRFIRLSRLDGLSLGTIYVSGPPNSRAFVPAAVPPLPGGRPPALREETAGAARLLIAAQGIEAGGSRYVVEAGVTESEWRPVLRGLALSLAFGLPALAAAAALGGYFLIGRALAPVDQMAGAAKRISLHDLDQRLPVSGAGDELQTLAEALNDMIARLDEAFQHASRFSADASHELRTPLTIMRGELEGALRDLRLDGEGRDRLASILEETERLAKIVEGLFAISRLESGEAVIESSRFDLSHLAVSTAEQMRLLAEERRIALSCRAAECVEIQGDRARLKQVVVNLLDNAIKYAPPGGRVALSVGAEGGAAVLRVANSGPGIPPEALSRLFDRFFRAANGERVEGSGLGLSIVRSICLAHGGSAEAANAPGSDPERGCVFTVRLPLPPADLRGGFFQQRSRRA